jgi:hypothetical protein
MVPRVNVCAEGKQKGRKREAAGGHSTTHLAVLFEGLLRVTDKDAFLETLTHGIGPAKAFGFGLLSVAAVSDRRNVDQRSTLQGVDQRSTLQGVDQRATLQPDESDPRI